MALNYTALKAVAKRLIDENGRAVTLRRESRTPDESVKPWGPSDTTAAEAGSAVGVHALTGIIGVFLDVERDDVALLPGRLTEEKRGRVLFPAEAALPEEVGPDWVIDDGTRRFEVVNSKPVKPGGVLVYYDVEVQL
jgi:hypothetical protein